MVVFLAFIVFCETFFFGAEGRAVHGGALL